MGSAYTPGLTVSGDIIVRRTRRLPIKGQVLTPVGTAVTPDTVVAQALLPGPLQTIKLAEKLGVEAKDMEEMFQLKIGDAIEKGQVVAESKGFFGMFKSTVLSEFNGTVEAISGISGHVLIREAPIPVEVNAYINGKIVEVIPEEGTVVETRGAMVQGIFGVGGERHGNIRVAVNSPDQPLEASMINADDQGKILVGGSCMTYDAITRAAEVGALGIVAGGVRDVDLTKFIGYDIGVAITGQEAIPLTIVVTEGFGTLAMAIRTFELLKALDGKDASINGATQIRAGVIRPEVIVTLPLTGDARQATMGGSLEIGTPIRVIREPYFGQLGTVTELPAQLMVVDSGADVRVLRTKLDSGEEVLVPRANVEIISS